MGDGCTRLDPLEDTETFYLIGSNNFNACCTRLDPLEDSETVT